MGIKANKYYERPSKQKLTMYISQFELHRRNIFNKSIIKDLESRIKTLQAIDDISSKLCFYFGDCKDNIESVDKLHNNGVLIILKSKRNVLVAFNNIIKTGLPDKDKERIKVSLNGKTIKVTRKWIN